MKLLNARNGRFRFDARGRRKRNVIHTAPKTCPTRPDFRRTDRQDASSGRGSDAQLAAAGWLVQKLKDLNFNAAPALAIREYQTDVGPADYVLVWDKQPIGVIEAKV